MARSGNCWKRLAAIPPKAKKAAQTCQITQLGSRWSRVTPPRLRREAKTSTLSGVGPAVRIPSPPAVSLRTIGSAVWEWLSTTVSLRVRHPHLTDRQPVSPGICCRDREAIAALGWSPLAQFPRPGCVGRRTVRSDPWTSVAIGQCGFGFAPCKPKDQDRLAFLVGTTP